MIITKSFEASHSLETHIYYLQHHSLLLYDQSTTSTLNLKLHHHPQS